MGLVGSDNHDIFVCDYQNQRVQVFDINGIWKHSWLYEFDPTYIAISSNKIFLTTLSIATNT